MNKACFSLLVTACLTLAGCNQAKEAAPLAGVTIGGPFALIDQDGHVRHETDFRGRYAMIYFGYTFCPDACPMDMQHLAAGLKIFEKKDPARAAKVQPIFISVDPARDTPAVLKQWVSAFHPRLIGLTGTEAQIAQVAKEYAVYYKKQDGTGQKGYYLVDHARQTILFGPDGKPIALIPQDQNAESIAAELDRWTK